MPKEDKVTGTIYTRVPASLKEAVDAYAKENGKSLAGSVSELLRLGMKTAGQTSKPVQFSSPEQWCAEVEVLIRIECIARMMTDLGQSIIGGKVSDTEYYVRAREMLTRAVAEWTLIQPSPTSPKE